jgi:hypothetical protein
MYVVAQRVKPDSTKRSFPRLVQAVLGETYVEGDERWYEALQVREDELPAVAPVKVEAPAAPTAFRRALPRAPSASVLTGSQVFALSASVGGGARDSGARAVGGDRVAAAR